MSGGDEDFRFITDPVDTYEEAELQLDAIANYTIHLHDTDLMIDYTNAGIIQIFRKDDGEWTDFDE